MTPTPTPSLARAVSQVRKFGWRLLWHRHVTRKRILRAGTIHCRDDANLEVHMLVGARDWLDALWTLHSFWHAVRESFQLVVFCDRTVTEEMQAHLQHRLPGADIIPCERPSSVVKERFAERFPGLFALRSDRRFFTLPRLIDSYALRQHDVVLTMEPGVIFFAKPDEMLADLNPARRYFGRFNAPQHDIDPRAAFCIDAAPLRELFGVDLPPRFDCGLGSLNYAAANWEWIEHILKALPPDPVRAHLIDSTICWLLSERGGWEPLPPERYAIEPVASLDGIAARHYARETRNLLYVEGIAELLQRGWPG